MVCNIGGQLGTKVVIPALGMLALYMRFNGTGIWGGETILVQKLDHLTCSKCLFMMLLYNSRGGNLKIDVI